MTARPNSRLEIRVLFQLAALMLLISSALIVALAPEASASGYTVSVSADSPSYSGAQTIHVTGSISPAPVPSGTEAGIHVSNPGGTLVRIDAVPVDPSTGAFSDSFVAGGTNWNFGTYTLTATWSPSISGPTYTDTTTFTYGTTTTTSTTSSTTSTTSSSTSVTPSTASTSTTSTSATTTSPTTTSATTTSSSTSSGGGGIPEFPVQLGFTLLATVVIVTSYVLIRRVTLPRL